ncbi:hypothetical protein QYM46_13060 [Brevibacterium sp. K11IcPPYGO002]|uniref:hypothetical protein n=1 Tax=Brevibacterium sp. K11IcPPYGO002 TaxID=3058837 RepID=UPI003D81B34B
MTEKYTPDEAEVIDCYAGLMEEQAGENYDEAKADAERGIAKIKADALREAADDLNARANGPSLIESADKWAGWYGGVRAAMQSEESALRLRADRIEEEA